MSHWIRSLSLLLVVFALLPVAHGRPKAKNSKESVLVAPPAPVTTVIEPTQYPVGGTSASPDSEFFHQAEPRQLEVTPGLSYGRLNTTYKNSGTVTSSEFSTWATTVSGEYGLTPMFAVGGTLGYAAGHNTYAPVGAVIDDTSQGFSNLEVYGRGRYALTRGTLRFGGELSLSPTKKRSYADGSSNQNTGGHTLTPYVGYDLRLGPGVLGAVLAYDLYKGDRYQESIGAGGGISGSTVKQGETVRTGVFYELTAPYGLWGASLTYAETAKTKTVSATTNGLDDNNTRSWSWDVYGAFAIAPRLTLLPNVSYGSVSRPSGTFAQFVDRIDGWSAGARLRFAL